MDTNYRDLPFKVESTQFAYLGIEITRKFKDLFKENFLPLYSQIKLSLCSFKIVPQYHQSATSIVDRTRGAWEQDVGHPITADRWDLILNSIHKSSLCARYCLIQFKLVYRAHMSKSRLASMYLDVTPTCDKCK